MIDCTEVQKTNDRDQHQHNESIITAQIVKAVVVSEPGTALQPQLLKHELAEVSSSRAG